MINLLAGDSASAPLLAAAAGKEIRSASVNAVATDIGRLEIVFADGTGIAISDEGQSCCENRYMVCDDDLAYFTGATFIDAEVRDAPDVDDGSECHEVQFLLVHTSKGEFTVATHNEHNGYYGGFSIRVSGITP